MNLSLSVCRYAETMKAQGIVFLFEDSEEKSRGKKNHEEMFLEESRSAVINVRLPLGRGTLVHVRVDYTLPNTNGVTE